MQRVRTWSTWSTYWSAVCIASCTPAALLRVPIKTVCLSNRQHIPVFSLVTWQTFCGCPQPVGRATRGTQGSSSAKPSVLRVGKSRHHAGGEFISFWRGSALFAREGGAGARTDSGARP